MSEQDLREDGGSRAGGLVPVAGTIDAPRPGRVARTPRRGLTATPASLHESAAEVLEGSTERRGPTG